MIEKDAAGWGAQTGVIFDIQRYSIHDGPGIRTVVFLKGCPLRCPWCSNPESQKAEFEVGYSVADCVLCGACVKTCARRAIEDGDGRIRIDRGTCDACGACVGACLYGAMTGFGMNVTVEEVVAAVEKDRVFYERSGGGVTLSGGEPLAQPAFCLALLGTCKSRGLHTVIETTGCQKWEIVRPILDQVDIVLLDIKTVDSALHERVVGLPNETILSNAQKMVEYGKHVVIRVPVIPGFNGDETGIRAIAAFARRIGVKEVHLLPYHRLAEGKYARLGREYPLRDVAVPDSDSIRLLAEAARDVGVAVQVGG